MAMTVSNQVLLASGPKRVLYAQITMDASYLSGGEVIAASAFGLQAIDDIIVSGGGQLGFVVTFTASSLKFTAFANGTATATSTQVADTAPLSQVQTAVDLSAVKFGVIVVGI